MANALSLVVTTLAASYDLVDSAGHGVLVDVYSDGDVVFWPEKGAPLELPGGEFRKIRGQGRSVQEKLSQAKPTLVPFLPMAATPDTDPLLMREHIRKEGGVWLVDLEQEKKLVTHGYRTREQARRGRLAHRIGDESGRVR